MAAFTFTILVSPTVPKIVSIPKLIGVFDLVNIPRKQIQVPLLRNMAVLFWIAREVGLELFARGTEDYGLRISVASLVQQIQ